MKKILLVQFLLYALLRADDPSGSEILSKLIEHMNPRNAQGVVEQTIVTTSGEERVFKFDTFMGNRGEKSLMRYLEPSRVKGNALLMTNFSNNIWMYNRRTNRVRKLASSAKNQKFEGSDFTYEDLGSGDSWKDNYKPLLKGIEKIKGERCYCLELVAQIAGSSYQKLVCFVRVTDFFPLQIDYYDKAGVLLKSLYLENIQEIEGILTPLKMKMQNHLDQTKTEMQYLSITYNVEFDEYFFTERNLSK
jgi:outer membrane lipoprotein-sorting protein